MAGAVWAMKKWYGAHPEMTDRMDALLTDLYAAFGWKSRITAPLVGRYLRATIDKEEKRLAAGWSYEPETFYEKNSAAINLTDVKACRSTAQAVCAQWITAKAMAT
jgi:hypothetical protein